MGGELQHSSVGRGKSSFGPGDRSFGQSVSDSFPASGRETKWRIRRDRARWFEHHVDVRGEGIEIAERFNDWGFTAFVLTYRLSPRYGEDARVADGKRALQLVRSRAGEFKLDTNRVGFAGSPRDRRLRDPSRRPQALVTPMPRTRSIA